MMVQYIRHPHALPIGCLLIAQVCSQASPDTGDGSLDPARTVVGPW